MNDALLRVETVSKKFGGFSALSEVSMDIGKGERVGLIGPNGSGKSTLVNCISGALRNEAGAIVFDGQEITSMPMHKRAHSGIARTFQLPLPFSSMVVLDNLLLPLEYISRGALAPMPPAQLAEEAMSILSKVSLAHRAETSTSQLSQVDLRKLELARAIAVRPRLLISDEALAGLTMQEASEILDILFELNEAGMSILMIEHIMQAVMEFSQRVVCLEAGTVICEGLPQAVFDNAEVRRAYLGT
jgi:branched-chain amino acid transport system ATP-binding protein